MRLFWEFRRVLRKVCPDLIHAGPIQTCGFFTALAGFKPFLLMSWGSDVLAANNNNPWKRWVTRFTIRRADMIACDCLAVRDRLNELAGYPASNVVVFPWGVDLNQFHPAPSKFKIRDKLNWRKDNKVIITTRSLEPIYGIETFLEAVRVVVEKKPDVRILMLGGGSLEPKVQAFITRHDLGDAIHLTGRVSHDMLPDYFNEASLYVSCSYSDGTSVSLLEAMACGLPAVVTDLPSNREWVTPGVNGWLVPRGDAPALSSAVLQALEQEDKTKLMAMANISLARQKADWNRNFTLLLEAYKQLAAVSKR